MRRAVSCVGGVVVVRGGRGKALLSLEGGLGAWCRALLPGRARVGVVVRGVFSRGTPPRGWGATWSVPPAHICGRPAAEEVVPDG